MIKSNYIITEKDSLKSKKAHEILFEFQHNIKHDWVSQTWINRHDRLWIQTFNTLVSQGLIEKKKIENTYKYRWVAQKPF